MVAASSFGCFWVSEMMVGVLALVIEVEHVKTSHAEQCHVDLADLHPHHPDHTFGGFLDAIPDAGFLGCLRTQHIE